MGALAMDVEFDEAWYIKAYPDIARALQSGAIKSARDHYLSHGRLEGRSPGPEIREFIIHVGPHKTGTSYLQASLKKFRTIFLEKKIIYPSEWWLPDGNPSHYLLFKHLRESNAERLERDFARIQQTGAERVIISSEDLSDLDKREIEHLKKCIGRNKSTVVIYYRRWADRLVSAWKEDMHHGRFETFSEFIATHLATPSTSNQINAAPLIGLYCDVFGRGNIKLVSFDQLISTNTDIFSHFTETFLNVKLFESKIDAVNVSLSWTDAEIARALNAISPELWPIYWKMKGNIDVSAIVRVMEGHRSTLLLDERDALLKNIQENIYAEFGDLLVNPKPASMLFEPKIRRVTYINSNYLLDPGLLENFGSLVRLLLQHRGISTK